MRRSMVALLALLLLLATAAPGPALAAAPPAPLLLIHGWGGSPETTWARAIPQLEMAGYQQGSTLFAIRLPQRSPADSLDLLADAQLVRAEIERIRQLTGATQVDLVGHSRGGLLARIVATGETAPQIRRAVSISAPHQGILPGSAIDSMLVAVGLPTFVRAFLPLPAHLQAGSPALTTLAGREARFADQAAPALAIGAVWQPGSPAVLDEHDGIVALTSQHGWPGARHLTLRLGPDPTVLAGPVDPLLIATQSPHASSAGDPVVIAALLAFLGEKVVPPPARPCAPACADWADLTGHWAAPALAGPLYAALLPYTLAPDGSRQAGPDQPMTRAEFVYGLLRHRGTAERLGPAPFPDLAGHWAVGYVAAARAEGLVTGVAPDRFAPDRTLTRAEAATLVVRALGLAPEPGPSPFADMAGREHWAEGFINVAAQRGLVRGDGTGFRPDDPVTRAEGGVILLRAFGTP